MYLDRVMFIPVYCTIGVILSVTLDYLYNAFILGQANIRILRFDNGEFVRIERSLGAGYNGIAFKTAEDPPSVVKVVVIPYHISVAIRKLVNQPPPETEINALKFVKDFESEYRWKGRQVIKMKFHEGQTLKKLILDRTIRTQEELQWFIEMTWNEVLKLRERGLSHGDVNWNNVLFEIQDVIGLTEGNQVKASSGIHNPITNSNNSMLDAWTNSTSVSAQKNITEIIFNNTESSVYTLPNRIVTTHLIDFGFTQDIVNCTSDERKRRLKHDQYKYERMQRRSRKLLKKVQEKNGPVVEEDDDDN